MGARARFKARNESSGIVGRCGVQIHEKRHHSVSQRHLEGELRAVKAMLSQPMAGKTDEEIVEARGKAVEALESMGYEVVNTLFTDEWYSDGAMEERGVVQAPLCYLAKSLENMSLCHVAYFCPGWEKARGCLIEHEAATAYGLDVLYAPGAYVPAGNKWEGGATEDDADSHAAGKVAWVLCVCDSAVPVQEWADTLQAFDLVRRDGALFAGMVPILGTSWEAGTCEAVLKIRGDAWSPKGSVAYVCFSKGRLREAERVLDAVEAFGIETVMVGDWTGE